MDKSLQVKQMKWIKGKLYYKDCKYDPWQCHTTHPEYVQDYPMEGISEGYATMQKLLAMGYTYD